jgi:integrase
MARNAENYTVIERGNSEFWYYRLSGWKTYKSTGIRIERTRSGVAKNRAEAERYAAEKWRYALERGDSGTAPTLRVFLEPFFIWGKCPHIERRLTDKKSYSARFAADQRARLENYVLSDPIAGKRISEIAPGDIEDLKARLSGKKVGTRTINLTLSALSAAFGEQLHRQGTRRVIEFNPVRLVGRIAEEPEDRGVFSRVELVRMFSSPSAWGYDPAHIGTAGTPGVIEFRAFAFAYLFASTGERPGTILRCTWADLDGDLLTFRQTKTKKGKQAELERTIPLTASAVRHLERVREESVRISPADPIFCADDGEPPSYTWFRKRFHHMMDSLKLPELDEEGRKRVPYSLKYTLETHLLEAGADEILLREYMGHSHGSGTSRVLTRAQARYKKRRIERLRELLPEIEALFAPVLNPSSLGSHDRE